MLGTGNKNQFPFLTLQLPEPFVFECSGVGAAFSHIAGLSLIRMRNRESFGQSQIRN